LHLLLQADFWCNAIPEVLTSLGRTFYAFIYYYGVVGFEFWRKGRIFTSAYNFLSDFVSMGDCGISWNRSNDRGYSSLPNQYSTPSMHRKISVVPPYSVYQALTLILLCLAFFFTGWISSGFVQPKISLGASRSNIKFSPYQLTVTINAESFGTTVKRFEYNALYSAAPSQDSDRAWAENLPRKYLSNPNPSR
jgi:hypothetical protein